MIFRCVVLLTLSTSIVTCADLAKNKTQENKIRLQKLIDKKNASQKHEGISRAFDYLADSTNELLEQLKHEEDPKAKKDTDSNAEKRQATLTMIIANMANMEKLLNIMASPEPEPQWQDFCTKRCDDPSWVAICNRPAKNIPQPKRKKEDEVEEDDRVLRQKKRKIDESDLDPGSL